ncbi:MAG: TRAP transporter small permease subunit [Chloroflexota bacterium]
MLAVIRFLLRLADTISSLAGKLVSFLMTFTIGIMIYAIIRRYAFNAPWAYEKIVTNFLATYVMIGAAYAFRSGAFINVDILERRLPLRARAVVSLLASVLLFIFLLTLIKVTGEPALKALPKTKFTMQLIHPLRWPVTLIIPVGVILLIVQGLAKFIRNLITAITGKELT